MGSWHTRASAASITGACVFAVVTGAGAVFVGDWYGSSHHGTVVTEFVTTPASAPHGSNPAVARSAPPAATGRHARGPAGSQVQADARTARVAGSSPRAPGRHAKPVAAPVADDNSLGSQGPGPGSGRGSPSATGTETETPTPTASPTSTGTTGTNPSGSGNSNTDGSSGTASTAPPS